MKFKIIPFSHDIFYVEHNCMSDNPFYQWVKVVDHKNWRDRIPDHMMGVFEKVFKSRKEAENWIQEQLVFERYRLSGIVMLTKFQKENPPYEYP